MNLAGVGTLGDQRDPALHVDREGHDYWIMENQIASESDACANAAADGSAEKPM